MLNIILIINIRFKQNIQSMNQGRTAIIEEQFNQFIISIKGGAIEQIDTYLDRYGGEVANRLDNQHRQPPLYFAINLPDDITSLTVIKKLISKGANPNFKDQNEQTIIFYACRDGKVQCVNYLQSIGISMYEEDAYGQTPLYYIASQNQISLLEKYDKVQYYNHVDKLAQQTPLYYAAKKGLLEMCKALVANGCDPTHHDMHNKSAVEYARRARYHQVTDYLTLQIKKIKEGKTQQILKENSKQQQAKKTVIKKQKEKEKDKSKQKQRQMESESYSSIPKSFYKIVFINDQGQTKELTQQDVRVLVREKPNLESMLANPNGISRQLLENERSNQEKEKWQKVAVRILSLCWKHKGSCWFQQPVDPVKFNIMDYNDIITHPMDLGTIKKKLSFNFYSSPKHFFDDMTLVWNNCYKYNGPEHEISLCAVQIQKIFLENYDKQLKQYEK